MADASGGCLTPKSYVAPSGWANRTLHVDADGTVREYVSYLDGRRN